jgi:dephospho-CoA kinase
MRIIGLTGGIATGKSTVSAILRELGAAVIDADELARQVVEPASTVLSEIDRRFPGVVGDDGRLDRTRLAERIFSNPEDRAALDALLHPRIQKLFVEKTAALAQQGEQLVIYDAALLIENSLHEKMDGVILVTAPRETQITRLRERNGLTRAQAEARLSSQMPLGEKLRFARWTIDNSGDLITTRAQVDHVWRSIRPDKAGGANR